MNPYENIDWMLNDSQPAATLAAAADESRIKDGTKVLIDIIDELPDGDGSSIYKGIATVWRIRDGFIDFHDLDLIGKVSEIKRVYYKKSDSSCR